MWVKWVATKGGEVDGVEEVRRNKAGKVGKVGEMRESDRRRSRENE